MLVMMKCLRVDVFVPVANHYARLTVLLAAKRAQTNAKYVMKMKKPNVWNQSIGGARHGGRRVTSATESIESVKQVLVTASICSGNGSDIAKKGTIRRAKSQIAHELSELGTDGPAGSECSQQSSVSMLQLCPCITGIATRAST